LYKICNQHTADAVCVFGIRVENS